jgi:hypothetical protein
MACGCGTNRSAANTVYVLTMPNGQTSQHATRDDAEYQNSRHGGAGTVTEVRH